MTKITIGSDHAGYRLKEAVKTFLEDQGYEIKDLGCHGTESVDYPDYAQCVAEAVAANPGTKGVLVCGTGIGMSIAANKIKGIRAALCHNEFEAQMSRNHNDANIICLGARSINQDVALRLVHKFLRSDFEGDRHQRRIGKIANMEC